MSGGSARGLALSVLRRVTEEGAYSNLTLRTALERSSLDARDRSLAAELTYGTLRRIVALDAELSGLVERPLATAPPAAVALLRLGLYQLRSTRIPAHAAVAETVALASPRHRGFVNAVLRRAAAAPAPASSGEDDLAISLRSGLARWAVGELRRVAPRDTSAAALGLGTRAPLVLRPNPCASPPEVLRAALAGEGIAVAEGRVHPGSLVLEDGGVSPTALPGYDEGWFAVQDQASSFVVRALDVRPGDRVADVCAGPGGKAAHAACLVGSDGIVVGGDRLVPRAGLVVETAHRLRVRVPVVVHDARRPALRPSTFDRVLVDAPCTGIGSARRRPELLWRASREELTRLARTQIRIATAAAGLLAPGGRLVYSVCTFPHAETDAVCDALLRRVPDLEPAPIDGPDGAAERIRLWPHVHGTDAMFVAAFRRRGSD